MPAACRPEERPYRYSYKAATVFLAHFLSG